MKNPPTNASNMSSISDPGGSHMPQRNYAQASQLLSLSTGAAAMKSTCCLCTLEPMLCNKRSHCNETLAHNN